MQDNPEFRFYIETTPVERAIATGTIIAEELSSHPRIYVEQKIDDLIGSYARHSQIEKAVNLSPAAMSKVWAEAKKSERYADLQGEHKPLYAWCEQGFDNPQADNPDDPGISLREIACRLGTYIHQRLPRIYQGDVVMAIGHSGDIEPFLHLTLEMLEDKEGSAPDAMTKHFYQTDGALEPLAGLKIKPEEDRYQLFFNENKGCEGDRCMHWQGRNVSLGLFERQAAWFKDNGKSRPVLEQKLRTGK